MNPWDLSASDLLVWGIVLHLIADWPMQNHWMANNKMKRRNRLKINSIPGGAIKSVMDVWWDRHPAAYVHAGIHLIWLSIIFGWVAIPLAIAHLIIDCRWVVAKWSEFIEQTPSTVFVVNRPDKGAKLGESNIQRVMLMDIGTDVRIWVDQVFHIACVAVAALLIAA